MGGTSLSLPFVVGPSIPDKLALFLPSKPSNRTSPRSASVFWGEFTNTWYFQGKQGLCPPSLPRLSFPSSDENLGLRFRAETGNFHPFSGQIPSILRALLPDLHPEELGKSVALEALGFLELAGKRVWGPRMLVKRTSPIQRVSCAWARGLGAGVGQAQPKPPHFSKLSSFKGRPAAAVRADPAFSFQDGFYHKQLSSLGFRNAIRVTEGDTR